MKKGYSLDSLIPKKRTKFSKMIKAKGLMASTKSTRPKSPEKVHAQMQKNVYDLPRQISVPKRRSSSGRLPTVGGK